MKERRLWLERLLAADRICLSNPHQLKNLRTFLLIFSLAIVLIIGLSVLSIGLEYKSLLIIFIGVILSLLTIRYVSKNIHSTVIKGGTLILTNLNQRSYVTSVRSITNCRSVQLGSFQLTRIKYNLDGINRKAMILNSTEFIPFRTDSFLLKAKAHYKKQKANL